MQITASMKLRMGLVCRCEGGEGFGNPRPKMSDWHPGSSLIFRQLLSRREPVEDGLADVFKILRWRQRFEGTISQVQSASWLHVAASPKDGETLQNLRRHFSSLSRLRLHLRGGQSGYLAVAGVVALLPSTAYTQLHGICRKFRGSLYHNLFLTRFMSIRILSRCHPLTHGLPPQSSINCW